ncbi:hypothetical protein [Streptomyces pseudogriseolus]|uniref:hypothetical protein n=1 Tax=Streptomyces pseudogriseolus TaxID=36817 RepID=UPI003FA2B4CD
MSLFGNGALGRVVRSGVGRRRVQSMVIAVATMMAVASAVVAGALMVAAAAPFDDAFKEQQGAHITAQFDPAEASTAQLERTRKLAGVTASAGPYASTAFRPVDQSGFRMPTLTVVGRSGADAAVDRVEQVRPVGAEARRDRGRRVLPRPLPRHRLRVEQASGPGAPAETA